MSSPLIFIVAPRSMSVSNQKPFVFAFSVSNNLAGTSLFRTIATPLNLFGRCVSRKWSPKIHCFLQQEDKDRVMTLLMFF